MERWRQYFTLNMAKNAYFIATGLGVFIFMMYCLEVRFFPSKVSLSEIIFFLSISASFSLILCFFLLGWYSVSSVFIYLLLSLVKLIVVRLNPFNKKIKNYVRKYELVANKLHIINAFSAHFIIAIITMLCVYKLVTDHGVSLPSIMISIGITTLFIAIIPNVYLDRRVKKEKRNFHVVSIAAVVIFLFFMLSGLTSSLIDTTMGMIGVRKENAIYSINGAELDMARYLTGNMSQLYFRGDVIFTGIGESSLVTVNGKNVIVNTDHLTIAY